MGLDPSGSRGDGDLTASLIVRLQHGDTNAGLMLDRLYRERMIRFCWGYLGSREEAEDAVQDLFCKVLAVAYVPDSFRPWLYRAARNHCLNLLRARARRKDAGELPPASCLEMTATGHLTRLVKHEQRSRIGHLLAALAPKYREALVLRYAEGLSRAEIADVLGLSVAMVRSRLFEGLKKLRHHASLLENS